MITRCHNNDIITCLNICWIKLSYSCITSFFFPAPSRKWKQENVSTVSKHPSTFTEQTRSACTLKPSCLLSLSVQITALHPPSSLHYSWQRCRVCSWYLVVLMCLRHILYVGQDKVTQACIVLDVPAHALLIPQHICLYNGDHYLVVLNIQIMVD